MMYAFRADSNGGSFGYLRWRNKPLFQQPRDYIIRATNGGFGWIELIDPPTQEQIEAMCSYAELSNSLFSDEYKTPADRLNQ